MTLDEGIIHAEDVAKEQDKLCKRYDDASGYTRSHNEDVKTTDAKKCAKCADEHRQLAKWLKELKAYRDARAEINQALYDNARGEQNDYERGRKSGIFLCESIISVKLGEVKE